MSRVGKKIIKVPQDVKVECKDKLFFVEGKKGKLKRLIHPDINLDIKENCINVIMLKDERTCAALQGLTRSLVSNMIEGVSKGFEKILEINGIGYKAEIKGKNKVQFNLGYSHTIDYELPDGITALIDKNKIKLSGSDKELLGQTAAKMRKLRPPEPYKGKGVKYLEEKIQRKAGKSGAK